MLLFYRLKDSDPDPSSLSEQGLSLAGGSDVRLWRCLSDVPGESGPVVVVDGHSVCANELRTGEHSVAVSGVPPHAIQNVEPYRAPKVVTAAGGYVACRLPDGDVAILLIYRRGRWDLPKGTQDVGEDVVSCARREVCEEVGIRELDVQRPLDTTQHGYQRGDRYVVKTTHWHLMRTPERSFEPDRREGIQRVARARWDVARNHVGYQTLRDHMDRIKSEVRNAVVG